MARAILVAEALVALALISPGALASPLPGCPPNLAATAQSDGSVVVTWGSAANATSYNVYRAGEDGIMILLGSTPAEHPHWIDADPPAGETLSYWVTGVNEEGEAEGCGPVMVVAIPFLEGAAFAFAGAGALAAVVALRRR